MIIKKNFGSAFFQKNGKCYSKKGVQFFGKIQDYKAVTCLIFFEKKLLIYIQKLEIILLKNPGINQYIVPPLLIQ
jgi:hypothetical protein